MEDLTGEKLLLFGLVALPGFVAIRVYWLWYPRESKDWKELLTEAVTYSVINLLVWIALFPVVVRGFATAILGKGAQPKNETLRAFNAVLDYGGTLFLYAVVSPTLLVIVLNFLRRAVFARWFKLDNPLRTAWDWIFTEVAHKRPLYVGFKLKSKGEGDKPAYRVGYYNGSSYVASYPMEPEIYVERLHYITEEGGIGPAIPDSRGMFIRLAECEMIEFFDDPSFQPGPSFLVKLLNALDRFCNYVDRFQKGVSEWLEKDRISRRAASRRSTAARGRM